VSRATSVTRTTKGMQDHLFDVLDGLADGSMTPQHAQAVADVSRTLIQTARLEVDVARFVADARAKPGTATVKALILSGRKSSGRS
jgi:hypothetical protein